MERAFLSEAALDLEARLSVDGRLSEVRPPFTAFASVTFAVVVMFEPVLLVQRPRCP